MTHQLRVREMGGRLRVMAVTVGFEVEEWRGRAVVIRECFDRHGRGEDGAVTSVRAWEVAVPGAEAWRAVLVKGTWLVPAEKVEGMVDGMG